MLVFVEPACRTADQLMRLLVHLLATLSPSGEVVIGIDDTIERRWGGKIKARGIYRDAVRSSHGRSLPGGR